MLGAGRYPITVAELRSYSQDADRVFTEEEHERLKERLAFLPDSGDTIAGTGGVRKLLWPFKDRRGRAREAHVLYFFHDLNMPLYMLAIFVQAEWRELDDESRNELARLVEELVAEHGRHWARVLGRPENSSA